MSSRQTCDRCQRPNHAASTCWQKTTIYGQQLPDNKPDSKATINQFFEADFTFEYNDLEQDEQLENNDWPQWEETENYFDPQQSDANGCMQGLRISSLNLYENNHDDEYDYDHNHDHEEGHENDPKHADYDKHDLDSVNEYGNDKDNGPVDDHDNYHDIQHNNNHDDEPNHDPGHECYNDHDHNKEHDDDNDNDHENDQSFFYADDSLEWDDYDIEIQQILNDISQCEDEINIQFNPFLCSSPVFDETKMSTSLNQNADSQLCDANQTYVIPHSITHVTAHISDYIQIPQNYKITGGLVSRILSPITSKLEFKALDTGFQLERNERHLQRDILFYLDDFSPTITLKQHLKASFLTGLSKILVS